MDESSYTKCPCSVCSGHIEFPAEGVGKNVPCAHCGGTTELSGVVVQQTTGEPSAVILLQESSQVHLPVEDDKVQTSDSADCRPRKVPEPRQKNPPWKSYVLPGLDLLLFPQDEPPVPTKQELLDQARLIQRLLATFEIEVEEGDITAGPRIICYEIHPAPGVGLERISTCSAETAAAMNVVWVRVITPIPGKDTVGIKVPKVIKGEVVLRQLLFRRSGTTQGTASPWPWRKI